MSQLSDDVNFSRVSNQRCSVADQPNSDEHHPKIFENAVKIKLIIPNDSKSYFPSERVIRWKFLTPGLI